MDPELEAQMKMLEGLDMSETVTNTVAPVQPVVGSPVETAETLRGEVPFIPENPTNQGIVTNNVAPQVQANNQAYAQVVQPTVTAGFAQPMQPVAQPMTPPVQPVAPVQQMTSQVQPVDMNEKPVFVNLNQNTYQTKTDFLKLKKEERTRVTLINPRFVQRLHVHYIDGLGYFNCLSNYDNPGSDWPTTRAICCMEPNPNDPSKLLGAKNRLLIPVIEYPVSRTDGKTLIPGAKPKLKMWNMNYNEEKALKEILASYSTNPADIFEADPATFDLNLAVDQTSMYPVIKLVAVPSWRAQFELDIQAEIAKATNEFYNTARLESAKNLPIETIQNAMQAKIQQANMAQAMAQQPVPQANSINFNI